MIFSSEKLICWSFICCFFCCKTYPFVRKNLFHLIEKLRCRQAFILKNSFRLFSPLISAKGFCWNLEKQLDILVKSSLFSEKAFFCRQICLENRCYDRNLSTPYDYARVWSWRVGLSVIFILRKGIGSWRVVVSVMETPRKGYVCVK